MGFSKQEYWSELPFPSAGDLSDPGIEPASLVSPALAGRFFTIEPPGKPFEHMYLLVIVPDKMGSGTSLGAQWLGVQCRGCRYDP